MINPTEKLNWTVQRVDKVEPLNYLRFINNAVMALSVKEPKLGDLIRIERGFYQHWALYVGDGYVVHLAAPPEDANSRSLMSVVADAAVVKKEQLSEAVGTGDWRVDNLLDEKHKPRSTNDIVKDAMIQVGRVIKYCVITWNCEHFVTKLRYGEAESRPFHEEPRMGDLIKIKRGPYQHWAVYIGDGYVVHLTANSEFAKERLRVVVGTSEWGVDNSLDRKYRPRSSNDIVSDAMAQVGRVMSRNVVTSNREPFTELRYGKAESRQLYEDPRMGDLIRVERGPYQHWAVYIGDGYVVHLTANSEANFVQQICKAQKALVRKEQLSDMVEDCFWRVDNSLDEEYEPHSTNDIVKDALAQVGQEMKYNVVTSNCEHFVTELRYGKAESRQVKKTMMGLLGASASSTAKSGSQRVSSGFLVNNNKHKATK